MAKTAGTWSFGKTTSWTKPRWSAASWMTVIWGAGEGMMPTGHSEGLVIWKVSEGRLSVGVLTVAGGHRAAPNNCDIEFGTD